MNDNPTQTCAARNLIGNGDDADAGKGRSPSADEVRRNPVYGVDSYREADARKGAGRPNDCAVDADDTARVVDEGASRIPGLIESARHFRPRPQAAVIGRRLEPFFQRRKRFRRKDRGRRAVALSPVTQAVRSVFVVALAEQPDPAR